MEMRIKGIKVRFPEIIISLSILTDRYEIKQVRKKENVSPAFHFLTQKLSLGELYTFHFQKR